jgi:hypothetical protein
MGFVMMLSEQLSDPYIPHTGRNNRSCMNTRSTNLLWGISLKSQSSKVHAHTHLINSESGEWHVATAGTLEEESKLIEAGFEHVRSSLKDKVAIYRKRK